MKVKMLIVSFLVMGFGLVLYGCSNKLSSESNYPLYTIAYLNAHPNLVKKLDAACDEAEKAIGHNISKAEAFGNTNLSKDCTNSQDLLGRGMHTPINLTMPSAPAHDSILYDVPKP